MTQSRVAPVTLVQGSERALAERAIRNLRAELEQIAPDAETTTVSAADYGKGDMATLVSSSLFSDERVVTVTDLAEATEDFEADFTQYLKDPVPGIWMILEHPGGPKAPKVPRAVKAAGLPIIKCDTVKNDRAKADLVRDEVRAAGGSITAHAAQNLVSAIRGDLMELLAAARQLVSDSGGDVNDEDVRTYFRGRVETRPWEVAEAVAAGDGPRAFLLARQALETGVPEVVIVAALASTLRGLAKAKVPGLPNSEMGMPPWQIDKAKRNARQWSDHALGSAIQLVAEADLEVKGASKTPDAAVELCIIRVSKAFRS